MGLSHGPKVSTRRTMSMYGPPDTTGTSACMCWRKELSSCKIAVTRKECISSILTICHIAFVSDVRVIPAFRIFTASPSGESIKFSTEINALGSRAGSLATVIERKCCSCQCGIGLDQRSTRRSFPANHAVGLSSTVHVKAHPYPSMNKGKA